MENKIITKLKEFLDIKDEPQTQTPATDNKTETPAPVVSETVTQAQTAPAGETETPQEEKSETDAMTKLTALVNDINSRLTNVEASLKSEQEMSVKMQGVINILKEQPTGLPLIKTQPEKQTKQSLSNEDKLANFASYINANGKK